MVPWVVGDRCGFVVVGASMKESMLSGKVRSRDGGVKISRLCGLCCKRFAGGVARVCGGSHFAAAKCGIFGTIALDQQRV